MAQLESLLSLKQLRYFVSVVEHRGFTAAAQGMHVAQPALSRQVAHLEEAVGEQLLVRHAEGVTPTEAGMRLYDVARDVLERVNGAAASMRGLEREPQGPVSLVLPATGGTDLITEVVKRCKEELPKVELQVYDGISTQTGPMLQAGMVDFGVLPNSEEVDGLVAEPLFREYLYAVRAHDGRQRLPSEIAFSALANEPLVVGPRSMHLRRCIEQAARAQHVDLNFAYEQRGTSTIAGFVLAGLGTTITNWPSVLEYFQPGKVSAQRIVEPTLGRVIALVYPATRPLNHAARACHALVRRLLLARVADGRWQGERLTE